MGSRLFLFRVPASYLEKHSKYRHIKAHKVIKFYLKHGKVRVCMYVCAHTHTQAWVALHREIPDTSGQWAPRRKGKGERAPQHLLQSWSLVEERAPPTCWPVLRWEGGTSTGIKPPVLWYLHKIPCGSWYTYFHGVFSPGPSWWSRCMGKRSVLMRRRIVFHMGWDLMACRYLQLSYPN